MRRNSLWAHPFLVAVILSLSFSLQFPLREAFSETVYEEKAFLPAAWCTSVDISPDRSTIYARASLGNWNEGVRLYSGLTYEHITDFENLPSVPWSILASADGNHLYASYYYGGAVVKLHASTGEVVKNISVGPWPGNMVFDSERRYLYVGVNDPGRNAVGWIAVIDTSSDTTVGTVDLNGEPGSCLIVSPDDRFLYALSKNSGSETLHKISTGDYRLLATLPVAGVGDAGISVSPAGDLVYVADRATGLVRVVQADTLIETGTYTIADVGNFSVAPGGGHAVALSQSPSGGTHPGSYEVLVHIFDLGTEEVVQTITTHDLGLADENAIRHRIVWDEASQEAYVPLRAENGGVIVLSPTEERWQVVYQADFSTDPGWTTNSPDNFYWNGTDGTYHFKLVNTGEQYSYKSIPFDAGASYRLEFDAYMTRCDWAADLYLGLGDPDMDIGSATTWYVSYHNVDQGQTGSLIYYDGEGGSYHPGGLQPAPFQLNAWYHNVVTYDAAAGTLSLRVTKISDGSLVGEVELTGVGSFAGVDRLYMSSVGHHYASGATVEGYVDNIVLARATRLPQPPVVTEFAINDGADTTQNRAATLNNATDNDPTHYMASESPDFSEATWQLYSTGPEFTLSSGDGEKTIYFKTKNEAGESNVVSDTILLQAAGWKIVYSSDFSTDPGWTTNSADNFYWNGTDGIYHFKLVNTGEHYSYKSVPFDAGASYRLEFDAYMSRCDWAADLYLGLGDPDMDIGSATTWYVSYHNVDQGQTGSLIYYDGEGGSYHPGGLQPAPFQLNAWYHNVVTYDAVAGTLSLRVTKISDGSLVGEVELTGVGSFAGVDRLYMSSVGHVYAPGATAEGYIDNLLLKKEHYEPPKRPFEILPLSGPLLRITWDSEAASDYQLWATSDLSSSEWDPVGPRMGGTGEKLYIDDYVDGTERMFYRVETRALSADK